MAVEKWMSWEGGVDLLACTSPEVAVPNVIVHVARMVHTPVGSAPSGIVFWQPDPAAPPVVAGFVSSDPVVGAYFGKNIFAGTPFEDAPALQAVIEIDITADGGRARVEVAGHVFESALSALGPAEVIHREPIATAPFIQQGLEAVASSATLKVDGVEIPLIIPPAGITGGPCAVIAATGLYAR